MEEIGIEVSVPTSEAVHRFTRQPDNHVAVEALAHVRHKGGRWRRLDRQLLGRFRPPGL
jgi:hypothetical protein